MKTQNTHTCRRASLTRASALCLFLLAGMAPISMIGAGVPVRLSVKFILNASGNRPATGELNTDEEVNEHVARANQMFADVISELRLENIEIANVAGASQWYGADPTEANLNALRNAAMANRAGYRWRDNAVNVYITGGPGTAASGIADFPPNNNIILLPQSVWDNVLAHEVGHILNLMHTHETCCTANMDECDDTLKDNQNWSRDAVAMNNFGGLIYSQLNDSQRWQVDQVWWNVMSYHNGDDAFRLTGCQLDRISLQSYSDRNWLLAKTPVYVAGWNGGTQNGSFTQPFQTVQQAVNANAVAGNTLVLQQGTHARPGTLNVSTVMIARSGASTLQCRPVPYTLPAALEDSKNAKVRDAVIRAQESDREGDGKSAIAHLQEAEKHGTGLEKIVLQLELGQRSRDSGRSDEAAAYFSKAADATDNAELRRRTHRRIETLRKQGDREGARKDPPSPTPGNR